MDHPGGGGLRPLQGGGPAAAQRRQAGGGLQGQPAAAVRLSVVHPVGFRPEQGPEIGRVRRSKILTVLNMQKRPPYPKAPV